MVGFKYLVKGKKVGLFYDKSYPVLDDVPEHESVKQFLPNKEPYYLFGHKKNVDRDFYFPDLD